MASVYALVVAAGRGSRFGGALPKQYLSLDGVSLLRHAVAAFAEHPRVADVLVAIRPEDRELFDCAVAGLEEAPAAIPCLPLRDTIKRAEAGLIRATIDRSALWRAQTPQGFHFDAILAAHRAAVGLALTDDAAVAEAAGMAPVMVEGSEDNLKVTTPQDLAAAERLIAARQGDIRVGQGFDVHPFAPGDHLWICGIEIPHSMSLAGHSDADVGLHALTDAVLGAIGAGDIGVHFPPSDNRWRGAGSDRFLRYAADLVRERGGAVAAVDVTIVCERPRIGPHRAAMGERVAAILGIAT